MFVVDMALKKTKMFYFVGRTYPPAPIACKAHSSRNIPHFFGLGKRAVATRGGEKSFLLTYIHHVI